MTATDPLRSKALACLREARVTVLRVRLGEDWQPDLVMARVKSSRENIQPYRVRFSAGRWSCTCGVGVGVDVPCPHAAAVALVTTAAA